MKNESQLSILNATGDSAKYHEMLQTALKTNQAVTYKQYKPRNYCVQPILRSIPSLAVKWPPPPDAEVE